MKVLRTQEIETTSIQIGDQINIKLDGLGVFTATAQKITDNGTLFLFDDCVADRPMNNDWTNKGGYEKSDLCEWVNTVLLESFPEDIRTRISNLTLPTYGQLFGHDDFYDNFEPDEDEQFPLMAKRKNRIADFEDDYEWYWMRNATKKNVSAAAFAFVYYDGLAASYGASYSIGVRPAFRLA